MSEDPTRNEAIRDAVTEAKNDRLEKATGVPPAAGGTGPATDLGRADAQQDISSALNSELARARRDPPVKGATEGPQVKTDPVVPPIVHAAGIAGLKAHGELAGGLSGAAAKAAGTVWEVAVTAEPGTRLRTAATHLGLDKALGNGGADPVLGQVQDQIDSAVNRRWPARSRTDDNDQPPLIR